MKNDLLFAGSSAVTLIGLVGTVFLTPWFLLVFLAGWVAYVCWLRKVL